MSFLTSAKEVIQQRQNIKKAKEKQAGQLEKELIKAVSSRLLIFLDKMPVASKLIAEFHEIEDESDFEYLKDILNFRNKIGFFSKDLGDKSGLLIQRKITDSPVELETFAIEFIDIFDLSIYFVPYRDEKRGFSCVVFDSSGKKSFFIDDIPFVAARELVVDYLEKHPNLLSE